MDNIDQEIASAAAALVVEEGMDLEQAKKRAARQLGLPARTRLPDNQAMDAAIREYISIFCADTQPAELQALRAAALYWMEQLEDFAPLLGGAVWHGTATSHSDIHLQLFHDDAKALALWLLDRHLAYESREAAGLQGRPTEVMVLQVPCPGLPEPVLLCLWNNDGAMRRGALSAGRDGTAPRGGPQALKARMAQ
ncbi:hypothetical protein D8I35_14940 [Corticibacter populi]|uniref:Uncharacterized protein n=1 Tax=Corticibacter populi TaxID=1550736 RepID=A0A3M6QM12_9BURK|nr:hypothetical protein [Corticibacter populi]RMX04113.1 hypothetical protein D8I35_14940 [Corticibacter populi]RZS33123.1 hypothetical protein EV687_1441 [Corticibacter populi]